MSTDFRPLTPIRLEDLFDGRLDGVYCCGDKDCFPVACDQLGDGLLLALRPHRKLV